MAVFFDGNPLSGDALLDILDGSEIEGVSFDEEEPSNISTTEVRAGVPSLPEAAEESDSPSETEEGPQPQTTSSIGQRRRRIWKKVAYQGSEHNFNDEIEWAVTTPLKYFEEYFPEEFFENAAHHTNCYFFEKTGATLNTSPQEIKKLFGMHCIIGVMKYPRVHMFWKRGYSLDLIKNSMTRDRFFSLRSSLHVVNTIVPPEDPSKNKFWKVQPVIDTVRNRCQRIERQPSYYSIDEQMVPFKGRCEMRQYVRGKPRPVGLKNFVITTSDGLMIDFIMYQGPLTTLESRDLGLGPAIVLTLANSVPRNSCLFFDRYFSTIPLLERLKERGLHGTGAIMTNRLNAPFQRDGAFKTQGDMEEYVSDGIVAVKWRDSKCITMVSSCTGTAPVGNVSRWSKKERKYNDVRAPAIVQTYNARMGGVDILDQQMEYYCTFIRTKKWTLKVIIHFLDLALVNSWREYKFSCNKHRIPRKQVMDLMAFRLSVGESLLKSPQGRRSEDTTPLFSDPQPQQSGLSRYAPARNPAVDMRYDGFDHLPIFDEIQSPRVCRMDDCNSRSKIARSAMFISASVATSSASQNITKNEQSIDKL